MISITLSQAAAVLQGMLHGQDLTIEAVTTDTRKVTAGCLFVALKGERFDAHDFAQQAKDNGAGALLVSRKLDIDLPQIVVKDTRLAFGELAAWVRQQVPTRVVALTGSSGKTSVKEMTAAILSQCGNTLYTAGNLNNDIGVPMTLLRLTHEHEYAVIELGANHQGEIAWTVSLTRPEAVLVNNLAAAHLEGFGSLAGVAKAKGEIYTGLPDDGIAIMNADNNDWLNWQSIIGSRKTWRFSPNAANSDFSATNIHVTSHGTEFTLTTPTGDIEVLLPLPGRHNIANALAAAALSMAVGASHAAIKAGLANLKAVPGRLFPIQLAENKLLLDDSYNANVGSMTAAVQVLSEMPGYRVMVVGDMAELGDESEACHVQVGEAAKAAGLDRVLSAGTLSKAISDASEVGEHFADKSALIERLKALITEKQIVTVLVKGSRSAAMEEVVHALQENGTC
ncbi:UDP-N-acetylmuramoyl-tripeptide--D-alanyl-D-alanine ligase [Enterobacter hormaechei subsp. steigerwaltii]|uniref:UDP-N-acetylmuramoyl-tripeptide--D-alanyl-D- alanine ligase n=1 Tax=Enterobacter hormaechei TaxID=158836 RepID=UPI00079482E8|nr:UDP-N-acetylmuramoyl-tripeptide--D-alanyl-D-alanine ligase [Enterobacter hormaechei]MCC9338660.1 UDP-N-acetylmuramoyl-tripeptide--D-alanyl-D-alanine ligase [Enterobacter hormaechei subsp. steigerwaltii]MCC9377125.1 UDP-N-acetylmuramoyl-tripeptide--D-alanyl-D-alanine ligase [Enterobacter hormaechei subsp. steigerwaltii]MCC9392060.1 UDP-N-acetylmuramoyl-tripeptide--D-alanyl-D-alanine ligase [Enterobacter hormaechei subsp. steigerwaltii]MCC9418574.1 UDP-N-acetylmuramoyl-tripeptide--D-alanyl-D-a